MVCIVWLKSSRTSFYTPHAASQVNQQLAGNMLHTAQCYVACRDIWNEKKSFNTFTGKTKIELHFENMWAVYVPAKNSDSLA